MKESKFTGGAFAYFGVLFVQGFVTAITLGLAYPAMRCWGLRWIKSHTYIDGEQMSFTGTGGDLFLKYIKWLLLTVITFGIYGIVLAKELQVWETKNTHIVGSTKESKFTGTALGLFGVNILQGLIIVFSLGFGTCFAFCYKQKWIMEHTLYDEKKTFFDGTAMELFGQLIIWSLLTFVTLGIYGFWLNVKTANWLTSHKHFGVVVPA